MTTARLTYAVITPARDEARNLEQLAATLASQTRRPTRWVVVDDGSTDETQTVLAALAREHDWIRPTACPGSRGRTRAEPIVRSIHHGLTALDERPDVVVKLDADISFDADHFERLLDAFEQADRLGIASGALFERDGDGRWRERHGTGPAVWGACRAYRWRCLEDILPLDERMGWDTIDLLKARLRGWETRVVDDLACFHHRSEGISEGGSWGRWAAQGRAAHYMGYRLSYLLLRTAFRVVREPASVAIVVGFVAAAVGRGGRCDDDVRKAVRDQQRAREVPARVREALQRRRILDPALPTRRE